MNVADHRLDHHRSVIGQPPLKLESSVADALQRFRIDKVDVTAGAEAVAVCAVDVANPETLDTETTPGTFNVRATNEYGFNDAGSAQSSGLPDPLPRHTQDLLSELTVEGERG